MKKSIITITLICSISLLFAQTGEWEINLFRTHLKMSYPISDEHESIKNQQMKNY